MLKCGARGLRFVSTSQSRGHKGPTSLCKWDATDRQEFFQYPNPLVDFPPKHVVDRRSGATLPRCHEIGGSVRLSRDEKISHCRKVDCNAPFTHCIINSFQEIVKAQRRHSIDCIIDLTRASRNEDASYSLNIIGLAGRNLQEGYIRA